MTAGFSWSFLTVAWRSESCLLVLVAEVQLDHKCLWQMTALYINWHSRRSSPTPKKQKQTKQNKTKPPLILLQAMWRWLWNTNNGIPKGDGPSHLQQLKSMMYATQERKCKQYNRKVWPAQHWRSHSKSTLKVLPEETGVGSAILGRFQFSGTIPTASV